MKMILFEEDWAKYPSAIVDTATVNRSFLEKSELLRLMGVKNNKWMLSLHNPRLLGVDPYDEQLDLATKAAIALECKENFWYAVRNVWRAPGKNGAKAAPIQANRANLALWWSFFCHVTFILIQPRQTGKSFSTDVLNNSLLNFHCAGTQINLLTKDDMLRVENVRRMKDIYEELPPYLRFKDKTDANNTDTITINRWKNIYRTHVPQSSEKRAANTARGLTTPVFQIDEPPFQPFIYKSMPAALAGMGAAREMAKSAGQPYGIILTTTAGKRDDPSGKFIFDYCSAAAPWSETFYDAKDSEHLDEIVRRNSTGIKTPTGGRRGVYRIYANFNHRMLGKTDEWLAQQIEELGATEDEIERDFLCRWNSGTNDSVIPTKIAELITKNIQGEKFSELSPQNYLTKWYVDRHRQKNYQLGRELIIGIDTSDASGGDDISFVGTDFRTGETVVTLSINETNLLSFAQFLIGFLEKYPGAIYVPERKNSAITIIDILLDILPKKDINPFVRIFNWVMCSPDEYRDLFEQADQPVRRHSPDLYVKTKRLFGFATSATGRASRDELYASNLQNAVKRCAPVMRDRKLCEQTTALIKDKRGRINHPEGGHDDMVIGFLLSHWFMTSAKNLGNYGLDPTLVYSEMTALAPDATPDKIYADYEQKKIRDTITKIIENMRREADHHLLERQERLLRLHSQNLVLKEGELFNVDTVLADIKQKKKIATRGFGQAAWR